MWKRRLLFSLLFTLGTLIAVYGWISEMNARHKVRYVAIAGHVLQVIGAFGSMIVPDSEADDGSLHDGDEGFRID